MIVVFNWSAWHWSSIGLMGVKIKTHSRYYGHTWSSKLQSLLSGDEIQMYWMLNKLHSSEGFKCLRVTVWVRVRGSEDEQHAINLSHTGLGRQSVGYHRWYMTSYRMTRLLHTNTVKPHTQAASLTQTRKESKTLLSKISRVYWHALWEQLNSSTRPHESTFVHMPACTYCNTRFHLNQAPEGKRVLQ